jgi:hypothetical protein
MKIGHGLSCHYVLPLSVTIHVSWGHGIVAREYQLLHLGSTRLLDVTDNGEQVRASRA